MPRKKPTPPVAPPTSETEILYRVEVQADSTGTWAGNALTYATREEAEEAARDLFSRWTAVNKWRVIDSDQKVHNEGP